jgi:hypothetical protein
VAAIDAQYVLEMAAAEDEDSVETISAESADPALGMSVRVGRLDRRADHPDALSPEDLVDGMAELPVAVVDEKPERLLVAELHDQVARLLATQPPSGFDVQATYSIRRVANDMKNRM